MSGPTRIARVLAGVLYMAALGAPLLAGAATGLTIQPVRIDQTINPGDSIVGTILLTNASDTAVDVTVSLEDFIPVAGAESYQFVSRAEGVTSVRDWISLGAEPFELAVGQKVEIPYRIDAPQNAEPGGHFGVVFFKATPADVPEGSLKVGTQVGMLVLVGIPGNHLEKGNILNFTVPAFQQGGPVPFSIEFQNTGTVHFEPKGEIVITNIFGQTVGKVPILGQIVLPTSVKTLNFSWPSPAYSIGRYTASATIYDGEGTALTSKAVQFWIVPLWYVAGFITLLVALYLLVRFIKRHVQVSLK